MKVISLFTVVFFFSVLGMAETEKKFAPSLVPTPKGCLQLTVVKPKGEHDLTKAISNAKREKKFLFIQYGRENCTNCQKVWNMLGKKEIKLPPNMLYADTSCDDEETRAEFDPTFSIEDEGRLYPYIVIMGPDGSQLAFRSGLGTPDEYNTMIQKAISDYSLP